MRNLRASAASRFLPFPAFPFPFWSFPMATQPSLFPPCPPSPKPLPSDDPVGFSSSSWQRWFSSLCPRIAQLFASQDQSFQTRLAALEAHFDDQQSLQSASLSASIPNTIALDGLSLFEGSSRSMGVATLGLGGTAVVATFAVRADSRIFVCPQDSGLLTPLASLAVVSRSAGAYFEVQSSDLTDRRDFAWVMFHPASPP